MKYSAALVAIMAPLALGASISNPFHIRSAKRQEDSVDELLFKLALPQFMHRRAIQDPPTMVWESDSCLPSPENPMGFAFDAACQRHDFGYKNYMAQNRLTDEAKTTINENYKEDLYNQCESEQFDAACRALADVYYEAARLFGRNQPTAIDALPPQDKVQYEEAVMNYLNEEGKI